MSSERSNRVLPPCGSCGSVLVHLTEGRETAPTVWEIEFRCPDCERRQVSYVSQDELEEVDRELDRAAAEIKEELSRLEPVHMAEWAAAFLQALDLDLIGPDDF